MTETEKQMLVSEVNLLRELRHPNIVRYHDRIIDRSSTTLYIVMEYCDGGDLASLIARCTRERCAAAGGRGSPQRTRAQQPVRNGKGIFEAPVRAARGARWCRLRLSWNGLPREVVS